MLAEVGHVLRRLRRVDEAILLYEKALAIDPLNAGALTGLAETARDNSSGENTISLLRRAVAANPWHEWSRRRLGRVLYELGRTGLGWRWFSLSHRQLPESVWLLLDWGAVLFEQARDNEERKTGNHGQYYEEAEGKIRKASQIDPWDMAPLRALGNLFIETGRLSEAMDQFERVLHNDPYDWAAYEGKGRVLRKQSLHDQAMSAYGRALEFQPYNTRLLMALGEMYQQLGQHGSAIKNFRRVLEVDPDDTKAARLLTDSLSKT
jgi:tetratricopeptide (TPR) repeat protein